MKKKEIPQIGLGTWLLNDHNELKHSINTALDTGYRHIDTAQMYNNEFDIGQILKKYPIERQDLYITTKIAPVNYLYHVRKSVEESLRRLQLNYIDLVLLHAELDNSDINIKAYQELVSLQKEGKINHIGVSNFSIDGIKNITDNLGIVPYCNQIICSPTTRPVELETYCKDNKIKLIGYSILKPYFDPNPFYPDSALNQEEKNILDSLCKKYDINIGQLLNTWAVSHGYNIIPKSSDPRRVEDNYYISNLISLEDMLTIDSMNRFSSEEYKNLVKYWGKNLTEDMFEKGLLYKTHFNSF